MLETLDLDKSISKEAYSKSFPELRDKLRDLQRRTLRREDPGGGRVRGLGRGRQGRDGRQAGRAARPARREGPPHLGAARGRAAAALPVALLDQGPRARGDGRVRPLVVRPRPGRAGGQAHQARAVALGLQRDRAVRADAHRRRHGDREVLAAHQREGAEEALQGDREEQVRLVAGHQGGLGAPQAVRRLRPGRRGDVRAHQHGVRAVDDRRGDRQALPADQGLQDPGRRDADGARGHGGEGAAQARGAGQRLGAGAEGDGDGPRQGGSRPSR